MICRKYLNILVLQSDISHIPPLYGWFETPLPVCALTPITYLAGEMASGGYSIMVSTPRCGRENPS